MSEQSFRRRGVRWAALLACGLMPLTPVWAETFRNQFSGAAWHPETSVFECRLVQPIAQFGAAIFTRRAGEEQRFVLHSNNRVLAAGEADIRAENPEWREMVDPQALGVVSASGDDALAMDWQGSQKLASALREGRRLVFSHRAWAETDRPVNVMVEPVGFRDGFTTFTDCLSDLLPVNFDQVERTALYFPAGFNDIPETEVDKLNRIAEYAKADEKVVRLYVDGHTDGTGLRAENLELSQERAELITQYLTDRGIPQDRIITRWHGERYPVGSNRTEEGRTENRRVTVRLERSDDRLSAR